MNEQEKKDIIKLNEKLLKNEQYAGLGRRMWGGILDVLILGMFGIPFFLVLKFFSLDQSMLTYYSSLIISGIYTIHYMNSSKQATLGSYFAGVRFARENALPINALIAIQMIVLAWIIDVAINFFNELVFAIFKLDKLWLSSSYLMFALVLYILPYFFTRRKQFLTDLILGIVAIKDDKIEEYHEQ